MPYIPVGLLYRAAWYVSTNYATAAYANTEQFSLRLIRT